MKREDIQPCFFAMPDVECPRCEREGKVYKLHGDLGILWGCGFDDCTYAHFLAWTDLDALKEKAS